MILYQVIQESTVCLPGCERRMILTLIEDMAYYVYNPSYFLDDPHKYVTETFITCDNEEIKKDIPTTVH